MKKNMQLTFSRVISPRDNRVLVEPQRAVQIAENTESNQITVESQNIANVESANITNVGQATTTTNSSFLTKTFSWAPAALQG